MKNDTNSMLRKQEDKLKLLLTKHTFEDAEKNDRMIEQAKAYAHNYTQATEGVAVISDFCRNVCHIYSGKFGKTFFGLSEYSVDGTSAFENAIFNRVEKDDLLERHILELHLFTFLESLPAGSRTDYQAQCVMRILQDNDSRQMILHTTRYLYCSAHNGSALCGICTYTPFPCFHGNILQGIVNISTGETVNPKRYIECGKKLLSKRQTETLALLADGLGSKQIADKLNISLNTVNRHRQDILSVLRVANTAAAVETGLRMHLI